MFARRLLRLNMPLLDAREALARFELTPSLRSIS
jgi:hypothetical protein